MPSSITANLNSPYLTLWQVSVPENAVGNPLSVSNNIATVGTHPFSTGDLVYTTNRNPHNLGTGTGFSQWYAIKISNTQLAFATTKADAEADIRSTTALSNSDSSITAGTGMSIANLPLLYSLGMPIFASRISSSNLWSASAKSAQTFQVTDNIQIDLTIPNTIDSSGISRFVPCYNSFGLIGSSDYSCGVMPAGNIYRGDTVSGMSSVTSFAAWTNVYRILIQDKRIYIQNRQTNGNYLTTFTSSELSLNIANLRLFANFSLNGRALTNCQITYL